MDFFMTNLDGHSNYILTKHLYDEFMCT